MQQCRLARGTLNALCGEDSSHLSLVVTEGIAIGLGSPTSLCREQRSWPSPGRGCLPFGYYPIVLAIESTCLANEGFICL